MREEIKETKECKGPTVALLLYACMCLCVCLCSVEEQMQVVGEVYVWTCVIMNDKKLGLRGILPSKMKCPWKKFTLGTELRGKKRKGDRQRLTTLMSMALKGRKTSLTGRMGGAQRGIRRGEERTELARRALVGLSSPPPPLLHHISIGTRSTGNGFEEKGATTHDAMGCLHHRGAFISSACSKCICLLLLSPGSEEVEVFAQLVWMP